MNRTIDGTNVASGLRFALVVSKFNSFITDKLLNAARSTIVSNGGSPDQATIVYVPGSFELPLACKKLAQSGKYDAVIALGAVIRGETYHFELICQEAARGITSASLETNVPIAFGLVSANTLEQAVARASDNEHNKGIEAALTAIQMANVCKELG